MILRFYLYSIFKNLRFADPFLVLFFLDLQLNYAEIGALLGMQHLITVLLEFPSGVAADYWGRRRATAMCFCFYTLAFAGYTLTQRQSTFPTIAWLAICLALFALGEALRTGSHKAIILDYLDGCGQSHLATQVIGRTRAVSKYSSAAGALLGGALLAWTRGYAEMFQLSAAASACGFVLMLTYPRGLEGEAYRGRQKQADGSFALWTRQFLEMWRGAGFRSVIVQSVLFESQSKIVLKYFTQPFLKSGLASFGVPIVAPAGVMALESMGALWVGAHECVRDALGGLAARFSSRFEAWAGRPSTALNGIYSAGVVAIFGLALCVAALPWGLIPGMFAFMALTALQNLRRPILVSMLNTQMVKSQRAATLSLESFCRAAAVALLLPLFGLAADRFGLIAVWGLMSAVLAAGLGLRFDGERPVQCEPAEQLS